MNTKTKLTALVTTILLSVGFAGPSEASQVPREPVPITNTLTAPVSAPKVSLPFDKVKVTTTKAPEIVKPRVVVQSQNQKEKTPVAAPEAPVAAPRVQAVPVTPPAVVEAPKPPVAASGGNLGLVGAARSQIGQTQDCTAMVERALGSLGIVTGDLAPAQFFRFGSVVSTPAPGDIIISAGHVGIYSGNGMMVSGGFNGNQTVEHPISYVGGYSAVRVA